MTFSGHSDECFKSGCRHQVRPFEMPTWAAIEDSSTEGADWTFGIDVAGSEKRAQRVLAVVNTVATKTGYEFVETFDQEIDDGVVTSDDIYVVFGTIVGGAADTDAAYDRLHAALVEEL